MTTIIKTRSSVHRSLFFLLLSPVFLPLSPISLDVPVGAFDARDGGERFRTTNK